MNERYKVLPVHVSDEQRVAASPQMNPRLHEVGRVELRRLEEKPAFVTMERASENKTTLIVREAVERSAARTCLHSAKSRAARKRGLSSMRSTSAASTSTRQSQYCIASWSHTNSSVCRRPPPASSAFSVVNFFTTRTSFFALWQSISAEPNISEQ